MPIIIDKCDFYWIQKEKLVQIILQHSIATVDCVSYNIYILQVLLQPSEAVGDGRLAHVLVVGTHWLLLRLEPNLVVPVEPGHRAASERHVIQSEGIENRNNA